MISDAERSEAFDRYVVPELAVLYRVALTLTREPHEAEDLVQDTLVKAFNALHQFDGAHPRAWLLTIVRNTHINRNRRRRPGLLREADTVDVLLERESVSGPSAEDSVLRDRFDDRVESSLRSLSQDHLRVVLLVDIDGLSYQQAAEVLGVPKGTVMSRLHRARARIRADLERAGLTPAERGAS
jgi:RNA polymerase sigma-70 factor (ECF subfamily)